SSFSKSIPHPDALRKSCSRLSSNANRMQRSPLLEPDDKNCVAVNVLPVPVAPETKTIESRKKPPPHISSSSATPEVIRLVEDFCFNSKAESGMTTIPSFGKTV